MISTVTLSFDLTASPPTGIVTDTTDYAALGIDLVLAKAKGLGVISFNGDVIENKNTILDPMIDFENLGSNPQVFLFPLELDLNGNVANGVYTFEYSLRLNTALTPLDIVTIPTANTIIADGSPLWLVDFLEPGNDINLVLGAPAQFDVFIESIDFTDPNINIVTSTVISSPLFTQFAFDITNVQFSGVFTYSGCTQTTANVSFTYDCEFGDSGSWAASNTTTLASNEVVSSLSCTINYPGWATLSPTFPGNVFTTSLPYPNLDSQLNPLATGTYTVSLTQQIEQTQTDGLLLLYTTSVSKEFAVSCSGSLCGLTPCIESLRVAHANELQRNRISKYQVFVDNVLLYYAEAQNYRSCGETDKYRATLDLIKANLDASGCECACCDDNVYYWVSNNSATSVIDSIIESFQFRLFTLEPAGDGPPPNSADSAAGVQVGAIWENTTTGILYLCTANTAGNPTWVEFYDYQAVVAAADVSAVPGANLTADDVQGQLTQADALFTVIDGDITALQNSLGALDGVNGLTKVGDDFRLGGTLDDDTTIDVNGNDFIITSDDGTLQVIATDGVPLLLDVNRGSSGVGINALLTTTNTAGAAADGIGSSIWFAAENVGGSVGVTSKITSTWVNATTGSSNLQITTKNANVESPALTLNFNGSATLNEYGQGNFIETDPTYFLSLNSSGSGQVTETALVVPKVYTAILTQSGSADPTATVVLNTTGETIVWRRVAAGLYRCEATGSPFKVNKTTVFVNYGGGGSTSYIASIQGVRTADNYVIVGTLGAGATGAGPINYEDGLLVLASIKIEVYP
jgi:hypothetical protein